MKNRRWSEYLEYASLVGLGVGSVATVLSKQVLYTSAPLSMAVLMNLINRRRLEAMTEQQTRSVFTELDQRLTKHIELLNQHVAELPTPEMVGSVRNSVLRHNREKLDDIRSQVADVQQDMLRRLAHVEKQSIGPIRQDIAYLRDQYSEVHVALANLHTSLHKIIASNRIEESERAIAQIQTDMVALKETLQGLSSNVKLNFSELDEGLGHLRQQFRNLPPPIDPTSLRDELTELTRMIADLVPKRDLNALLEQIKALQHQQDAQLQTDEHLRQEMRDVYQQLQTLPDFPQFRSQMEETLNRELRVLNQHLQTLPNAPQFQAQIEETLRRELETISEQLQTLPDVPPYEFVFDLKSSSDADFIGQAMGGSRVVLEEALNKTRDRLILIWPWAAQCPLDETLMKKFHQFLNRQGHLDLGWCHTTDPHQERFLPAVGRQWRLDPLQKNELQTTLQQFLQLKRAYPKHFRFKVLGTVENFLVSDHSVAVLGITDALSTATVFQNVDLKLRTTDNSVIQRLIDRFENPILDPDDVRAYWNRAVTRYELGDKSGAIADLNCILAVNTDDSATRNMRGIVRYGRGDHPGAIQDFSDSIDIDPFQISAYCNRGFIRAERGDLYGAIADYSLAIQVQPESAIAYFYRGAACQNLNDYHGAISDYSQAIWYAPESAIAHYYRAVASRHQENHPSAMSDFETAAKLFEEQGSMANAQRALNAFAACQIDAQFHASSPQTITAHTPSPADAEEPDTGVEPEQDEPEHNFAHFESTDVLDGDMPVDYSTDESVDSPSSELNHLSSDWIPPTQPGDQSGSMSQDDTPQAVYSRPNNTSGETFYTAADDTLPEDSPTSVLNAHDVVYELDLMGSRSALATYSHSASGVTNLSTQTLADGASVHDELDNNRYRDR
ncbi:MAG TPA: tetratricopeptide repeat protein, partial [Elainellaceae cyanobacterium]